MDTPADAPPQAESGRPRRLGKPLIVLGAVALVALVAADIIDSDPPNMNKPPKATPTVSVPATTTTSAVPAELKPTATRLVIASDGSLLDVDLDARTTREAKPPGITLGDVQNVFVRGLLSLGPVVVVAADKQAYALADELGGPATTLGPADYVFPALQDDQVWLVTLNDGFSGPVHARQVTLTGEAASTTVEFPAEQLPLADTAAGLLVTDQRSRLVIRSRTTGELTRQLTDKGFFIDARTDEVAWAEAPCSSAGCPLHLYNVVTARDRVIDAPLPTLNFIRGGAFSPDGTMLAAFGEITSDGSPGAAVVIVSVASATATVIGNGAVVLDESIGYATWSPSSHWVFFSGLSGGIGAYRAGEPAAVRLNIHSSYSFVAVNR